MRLKSHFRQATMIGALALLVFIASCSTPPPQPSSIVEQPSSTPVPATAAPATTVPSATIPPAPQPSAPAMPALASDPAEFLQTRGKDLIYRDQKAVLKGINFDSVGAFGAGIGTGNSDDIPFIEADYADLSAAGANHARFGISFIWYQRDPEQFFQKIDQQVAWARQHRIWLTFAVFTTPGDCYEGYSESCPFWSNATEQQELEEFWVTMARRYNSEPAVAGYDLLNEPTPPDNCTQWYELAGRIRKAIAAVAPNQIVFIASCMDPANDLKVSGLPRGPNIVYEVHDYAPLDMSHDMFSPGSVYPGRADDWFGNCYYNKLAFQGIVHAGDPPICEYANLRSRYGIDWAEENNVPIYIGEWGATSRLNGYIQYHKDKAELYREWEVNHAAYTWKHQTIKTDGFYQWGIYSPPHNLDDPARLEAVAIAWEGAIKPDFTR